MSASVQFNNDITAERAWTVLHYDSVTGLFTWKYRLDVVEHWNTRRAGKPAGYLDPTGYIKLMISQKLYQAHRLAWLMHYGEWPKGFIDHINGDRADNRIANLRDVPRDVNRHNIAKAKGCTSKYIGVNLASLGVRRWRAVIKHNKTTHYLGCFHTEEEARDAYLEAKRRLHVNQPVPRPGAHGDAP